jgi:hypothetical protein
VGGEHLNRCGSAHWLCSASLCCKSYLSRICTWTSLECTETHCRGSLMGCSHPHCKTSCFLMWESKSSVSFHPCTTDCWFYSWGPRNLKMAPCNTNSRSNSEQKVQCWRHYCSWLQTAPRSHSWLALGHLMLCLCKIRPQKYFGSHLWWNILKTHSKTHVQPWNL